MSAGGAGFDAALVAFDAALAAWLARQATAEERLTSFAFREGQPVVAVPPISSHAALRDWILATVAAPGVAGFLGLLGEDGAGIGDLAATGSFDLERGDRVALATRIGVLAAGGLVARDLEGDCVLLTALGRAALALGAAPAGAAEAPPTASAAATR